MSRKITLFCMTQKGYKVLEAIFQHFPDTLDKVVSSRDANVEKDYYDEIKSFCDINNLKFQDKKGPLNITSDFSIAVSWRWLIDTSSTTLIVFHDSLLPKYRGFSPLVSTLIKGERETGVTALFANSDYDSGDIIAQSSRLLTYPIKIQQAIELLLENYIDLAIDLVEKINKNADIPSTKQEESQASYSLWRDNEDYTIEWDQTAEQIKRFIDAVGPPYKGSLSTVNGIKSRILDVTILADVHIENRTPGKVIFMRNSKPVVVCGSGLLMIEDIIDDKTGKSLLPFSSFKLRFK